MGSRIFIGVSVSLKGVSRFQASGVEGRSGVLWSRRVMGLTEVWGLRADMQCVKLLGSSCSSLGGFGAG